MNCPRLKSGFQVFLPKSYLEESFLAVGKYGRLEVVGELSLT